MPEVSVRKRYIKVMDTKHGLHKFEADNYNDEDNGLYIRKGKELVAIFLAKEWIWIEGGEDLTIPSDKRVNNTVH